MEHQQQLSHSNTLRILISHHTPASEYAPNGPHCAKHAQACRTAHLQASLQQAAFRSRVQGLLHSTAYILRLLLQPLRICHWHVFLKVYHGLQA